MSSRTRYYAVLRGRNTGVLVSDMRIAKALRSLYDDYPDTLVEIFRKQSDAMHFVEFHGIQYFDEPQISTSSSLSSLSTTKTIATADNKAADSNAKVIQRAAVQTVLVAASATSITTRSVVPSSSLSSRSSTSSSPSCTTTIMPAAVQTLSQMETRKRRRLGGRQRNRRKRAKLRRGEAYQQLATDS